MTINLANQHLLEDIIIRTQAVEDDFHFEFTSLWHTRYNILMQKCIESPEDTKTLTGAMYDLIQQYDMSILLAVNESMSFALAHDLGGRLDRRAIPGYRAEYGDFYIHSRCQIPSGAQVVIVDEGINTGTAVLLASALVRSHGAKAVCVVTAYTRYPYGVYQLEEKCDCPVHYLADFADTYQLVPANSESCDLCHQLESIERKLKNASPLESIKLTREKTKLLPISAYPRNWGYRVPR